MGERFDPFPGLQPIGYWTGPDRTDLPNPEALIDETWDHLERQRVGDLLGAAATNQPGEGCSICRICCQPNGFVDLTDGTYVWPEGLAHYVRAHAVRLPADVVERLLSPTSSVDPELANEQGRRSRSVWVVGH